MRIIIKLIIEGGGMYIKKNIRILGLLLNFLNRVGFKPVNKKLKLKVGYKQSDSVINDCFKCN